MTKITLRTTMLIWILGVNIIIMSLMLGLIFFYTRQEVMKDVEEIAVHLSGNYGRRIGEILNRAYIISTVNSLHMESTFHPDNKILSHITIAKEKMDVELLWHVISDETIEKTEYMLSPVEIKYMESIKDSKFSRQELTDLLVKAGFSGEDMDTVFVYTIKKQMEWFLLDKKTIGKLKDKMDSEQLNILDGMIDRTLSEQDFEFELESAGFTGKDIEEIKGLVGKKDRLFPVNKKTVEILEKELREKFNEKEKTAEDIINKKISRKDMYIDVKELLSADLTVKEAGQICSELYQTKEGLYEIEEGISEILKAELKASYLFNLNYIESMRHRTVNGEELRRELSKLNFTGKEIEVIKSLSEKLYDFIYVSDPYRKEKSWIYIFPLRKGQLCFGFVFPEKEVLSEIQKLQVKIFIAGLSGIILLLIIIIILSSSITGPVSGLVKVVRKVATGNLEHKISLETSIYEVDTLEKSFNNMVDDLKKYIDENQKITAEKERIAHELSVANKIQMSVIPQIFPAFPDRKEIDIYGKIKPALEVGGDFYDFAFIDENHLGFVIGDASGKGVPAAMFVAVSRAFLKANSYKGYNPGECFQNVNNLLCGEDHMDMFITMFYGTLNTLTGELHYCNAGHNPPYLIKKDGTILPLKMVSGPALGAMDGIDYSSTMIDMEDGIFLYTDGITEAFNEENEEFTPERLCNILKEMKEFVPQEAVETVVNEVVKFAGKAPQSDDMTVLAIKYTGKKE